MLNGFKKFILRGNIFDMATGIIIGSAFTSIVKSLVDDVITPPLGLLINGIDFKDSFFVLQKGVLAPPYCTLEAAKECGAITINYGLFLNSLFSFLIVSAVIYFVLNYIIGLHKREGNEKKPLATTEEKILIEIRDILKEKK